MGYRRRSVILGTIMIMAVLSFPVLLRVANINSRENEISTAASVTTGSESERIYRWGLKRGVGGALPEVGSQEETLLLKYNGIYLGDTNEKKIYLTFDEGYENGYTEKILDVLKANDVKAVFFITGDYMKTSTELVRRMIEEGHEVGNHTMKHPSLATCSTERIEKELIDLDREIYTKFGTHTRFLRPPKGEYNSKVLETAKNLNQTCVMWSFAYQDWNVNQVKGADHAHQMVMNNLHNGAVLLLHAVSKDNADALDRIIKDCVAAGYSFGTPDELAKAGGGNEG